MFKDRLEIRSLDSLYFGLTLKQIKKEKVSKRENKIIADMFNKVHFVEKGKLRIGSLEKNKNEK